LLKYVIKDMRLQLNFMKEEGNPTDPPTSPPFTPPADYFGFTYANGQGKAYGTYSHFITDP
jgi:hypothetical protein